MNGVIPQWMFEATEQALLQVAHKSQRPSEMGYSAASPGREKVEALLRQQQRLADWRVVLDRQVGACLRDEGLFVGAHRPSEGDVATWVWAFRYAFRGGIDSVQLRLSPATILNRLVTPRDIASEHRPQSPPPLSCRLAISLNENGFLIAKVTGALAPIDHGDVLRGSAQSLLGSRLKAARGLSRASPFPTPLIRLGRVSVAPSMRPRSVSTTLRGASFDNDEFTSACRSAIRLCCRSLIKKLNKPRKVGDNRGVKQGDIVNILRDRLPIVDDVELRQELLLATDEILQLRRRLEVAGSIDLQGDRTASSTSTTPEAPVPVTKHGLVARVLLLHEQCLADKGNAVGSMKESSSDQPGEILVQLRRDALQQLINDAAGEMFSTEEGKEFLRNCQALFKLLSVRATCHQCDMPATLSFSKLANYKEHRWRFGHGNQVKHKVRATDGELVTSTATFPREVRLIADR